MSRSNRYQFKYLEIVTDPITMDEYMIIPIEQNNEELTILREKLFERVFEVAKEVLTDRQMEVLIMTIEKKTQSEIGELLDMSQCAVHKILNGNLVYDPVRKRHGGALKRLTAACLEDYSIEDLLFEIEELDI